MDRQQTRTPVKVSRYTYTADKKKLIINNFTQLGDVNEYKVENVDDTVNTLEEVKCHGKNCENLSNENSR